MNAVEQAVSALDSGRRPAGPRAAGERQPARTGECSRLAMRLPCAFLATGLAQDASKGSFTPHDPTADHWRFGVLLGGISRPLYAGWLALWTCLLKRIPSFFQKDSSGNASRVASCQPQKSRSASSETVALVVMEAPSAVRSLMSPWRLTRVFLRGASAPSLLRPSSSFRLVPAPLAFAMPSAELSGFFTNPRGGPAKFSN